MTTTNRWAFDEFATVRLGDKRLDARLRRVCQSLSEMPMAPINQACGTWADTKAAYRLFDNDKFETGKMLDAHRECIVRRANSQKRVLAVQDTTFLTYDQHPHKTGLGLLNSKQMNTQGLLAHNTMVTTTDAVPLGLFEQEVFARHGAKSPSWQRPIEEKESHRWLRPVAKLRSALANDISVVVVADREADIFDLFEECDHVGVEFVIRSSLNRVVGKRKKRWGGEKNANNYLFETLDAAQRRGRVSIEVEDRKTRKVRKARLTVKFVSVSVPAPWRKNWKANEPRSEVTVSAIEAKEEDVPRGVERLHWRLVTNVPVKNINDAIERLEWYKARWNIEIFHRILKCGCRIEEVRLLTFERMKRCITLYSIIAWRLFWMSRINRVAPRAPCTLVLDEAEWKPLTLRITHQLPKKPPSLNTAMRWMAQLGGFLARKSDGDPGVTTLWRGWQVLHSLSEAYAMQTCG